MNVKEKIIIAGAAGLVGQNLIIQLKKADTSYYYPEDRSISESIRFGKYIALEIVGTNND